MPDRATVVGLGEILWDLLPSGRRLGGAPANFAYCSHVLGDRAVVASRVGADEPGRAIRKALGAAGITDQFLQSDASMPTGTVEVEIDPAGQPKFRIIDPVAWDSFDWTPEWQRLAESADAVCFGSLAQRSGKSRSAIRKFLDAMPPGALRVFDVNLRQQFYSPEVVRESLARATVLKLNHEEVAAVRALLGIEEGTENGLCRVLLERFPLELVAITRGRQGSLLCGRNGSDEHEGFRVRVEDTIGAGDAFTAGLVHGMFRRRPLPELNDLANRLGAWVASHSGAMPAIPANGIHPALAGIR